MYDNWFILYHKLIENLILNKSKDGVSREHFRLYRLAKNLRFHKIISPFLIIFSCGFCQYEQIIFLFRREGRQEVGGRTQADKVVQSLGLLRTLRCVWREDKEWALFLFQRDTDYHLGLSIPSCFCCKKYLRLPHNRHFYFVFDVEQTHSSYSQGSIFRNPRLLRSSRSSQDFAPISWHK